jgi:hypothetical protein
MKRRGVEGDGVLKLQRSPKKMNGTIIFIDSGDRTARLPVIQLVLRKSVQQLFVKDIS